MQIDNLLLEKCLGKGSFGEVYLTKKQGDNKFYATKKYDRDKIENTDALKYLKNEITILQTLKHPNIVKFEDVKKTKKHYYIVMDYCNGGELSEALEKYQIKFGKPFPEKLVQYLMRQIISAFQCIHGQGFMHRDIKLENILLNYENEEDKENLNLMKAQIKIIDFGFACKISKNSLTYTAIGNPMNMDPLILKKLNSRGKKARQLGYDQKADIWSLGAICYEMLIGKAAFDADDMDELVHKIEDGKYKVPTTLSKEVVSFLNGMLQYDSISRLNIEQLAAHPFLTKNVNEFKSIDLRAVSNKLDDKKEIVIDVKNNTSIWAIFNKEDENKLMGINPGNLTPINENNENHRNRSQERKQQNNNAPEEDDNPIRQANTFQMKNPNMNNIMYQNNFANRNANNFSGPILLPAMQGIPGNQFSQYPMQNYPGGSSFSSLPMTESNYSFSGGIYN
jgi:serine/threonine protein kinase